MNLEQMRNRVKEILAKLGEYNALEDLSDEQINEVNALSSEFEGLKAKIETKEKLEASLAASNDSTRQTSPVATVQKPSVQVGEPQNKKNHGFKSQGEFFMAVKAAANGTIDQRLKASHVEKVGEDGGFLVPEDFRTEIKEKVQGDQSLLSLTDAYTSSGNKLSLPTSETAAWDQLNGIVAFWEGENKSLRESKEKLGMAEYRLHKLTAYVPVSEELLEDAPALASFIRKKAPQAIVAKANSAIINGDGAGKPEGYLNSGFGITVAAEGGQLADTIVYKNIVNMESRFFGSRGVYIAHPAAKAQLMQLKDDNGNLVYMAGGQFPNAAARPFDTLMGRPIIYMMGGVPALGDRGDISLVDLSYYVSVTKTSGIQEEMSTHVLFDYDMSVFKFRFRVAGRCPFKAPITTENGGYQMSGFVSIADR